MKEYRVGMYGGKFLPFHKGHRFCGETAALECESEDWEAETPLVRQIVGDKLDAVYSSEESYTEYFSRAYPKAKHRLVDVQRIHFPISGTIIRKMKIDRKRSLWIV